MLSKLRRDSVNTWGVYKGTGEPHDGVDSLPAPPPWRVFDKTEAVRGQTYQATPDEVEIVNAALYLRRPLLITGKPGVGKSSLAYAVAHELKLGYVLRWPITTRSTLAEGLYSYDAIGRLQEANVQKLSGHNDVNTPDIGRYIRLGPLGTAMLPSHRPRVLLVDEIDKSDIDLPNDLLHIFEEGEFIIPELARLPEEVRTVSVMNWDNERTIVEHGRVHCQSFPLVIFTSNGERDFPPAFLRRCLRMTIAPPNKDQLLKIVTAHMEQYLDTTLLAQIQDLIAEFLTRRDEKKAQLATDQLLNAIFLATQHINPMDRETLRNIIMQSLTS